MRTFVCDSCGESAPVDERRDYLPPESNESSELQEDEVETRELCLRCSTTKPNSRIFRRDGDVRAGRSDK